jgi:hypothetical protein
MAIVKLIVNLGAVITAFTSAWFWCVSAFSSIPPPPAGAFRQAIEPGIRNYYVAARKTARLNQMAAIFSGVTAALTGLGALLSTFG